MAAAGNEGLIPRPEKQTGCRKAIAQCAPWDDLAHFIDIVATQREDAVGAEAHRNRFPRCSRTCSPFPRSGIPEKLTDRIRYRYKQAVQIAAPST